MQLTTLAVPTARLVHLGLFPQRFFQNNESIEVLQALRLGGEDLTLLVRIRRRRGGPTEREVERQRRELEERYGLKHFELLSVDRPAREYTVLLRVSMTEGMGQMARRVGADLLPAQPCIITAETGRVSFYSTDAQLRRVRELLDLLGTPYTVERTRRASGPVGPLASLSERQRDLLILAHRLGYFESPAKTDLARIAGIAGISKAAVSKQMRAAQRKLVAGALGP